MSAKKQVTIFFQHFGWNQFGVKALVDIFQHAVTFCVKGIRIEWGTKYGFNWLQTYYEVHNTELFVSKIFPFEMQSYIQENVSEIL